MKMKTNVELPTLAMFQLFFPLRILCRVPSVAAAKRVRVRVCSDAAFASSFPIRSSVFVIVGTFVFDVSAEFIT